MLTFDQVLPEITELLQPHAEALASMALYINRDLNGRIRLIAPEAARHEAQHRQTYQTIAQQLAETLPHHTYPTEHMILWEDDIEGALQGAPSFALPDIDHVRIIDRLATEGRWADITPPASNGPARVVFFSIKGGVGRTTAIAACAWALAQAGKKVMVLDLDLASPGLSSNLLPEERRPAYGITDWLVEDLLDHGDAVFEDMLALSDLSHDGEILVVPAHGCKAGEYIAKLGRAWMPKVSSDDNGNLQRENVSQRLRRLLAKLEEHHEPDIVLIDSRSGIDDISSSCVTDLGAHLVLLFAIEGEQTWSGYKILFDYWHQADVARDMRQQLQLVGAMVPETGARDYLTSLREHSADLFSDLYDEIPAGATDTGLWNFAEDDETAPHYPWAIRWHRNFAALTSLHGRLGEVDPQQVEVIFGPLIQGLDTLLSPSGEADVTA